MKIFFQIALACLSVGVLLFIIGFSTNAWMVGRTYHSRRSCGYCNNRGLWSQEACDMQYYRCVNVKYASYNLPGELKISW
jgi:hypothetical protein